jgi:hypothetical protein
MVTFAMAGIAVVAPLLVNGLFYFSDMSKDSSG